MQIMDTPFIMILFDIISSGKNEYRKGYIVTSCLFRLRISTTECKQ